MNCLEGGTPATHCKETSGGLRVAANWDRIRKFGPKVTSSGSECVARKSRKALSNHQIVPVPTKRKCPTERRWGFEVWQEQSMEGFSFSNWHTIFKRFGSRCMRGSDQSDVPPCSVAPATKLLPKSQTATQSICVKRIGSRGFLLSPSPFNRVDQKGGACRIWRCKDT